MKFKDRTKKLVMTAFLCLLALFFTFPLFFTVTGSFMKESEINTNYGMIHFGNGEDINSSQQATDSSGYVNFKIIPDNVTFSQYYNVLIKQEKYLSMFWNSMKIAVCVIAGQLVVASMAAFAFSKLKFPGRDKLFYVYMVVMFMPFQVTLLPNYIVADKLHILNTHASIILPGIFSAFGVFLMRQFMMDIPDDYIEAAMIDGAGTFRIFKDIVIPMSVNAIAALVILVFIDNWNLVEQPLILLKDQLKYPLSLYLSQISVTEKGIAFAASAVYMIPMLLIFLYAEDYMSEGIKNTGIK